MPYFQQDVNAVAELRAAFEAVGLPLVIARKNYGILNAIEMQVEDEYANHHVVDALFEALSLAVRSLKPPHDRVLATRVEDCRVSIMDSLSRRVGGV